MRNIDLEQLRFNEKLLRVAVGVIFNRGGDQVLIARRPQGVHQGGLWEFPGGKVDEIARESSRQALCRELLEELALTVIQCERFMDIQHDYGDKSVLLEVWKVVEFSGAPTGNEGQTIAWVPVKSLGQYPFPQANQPILSALNPKP